MVQVALGELAGEADEVRDAAPGLEADERATGFVRGPDVVFGISSYSDHQHCYLFEHGPGQLRIEENKKRFDTVNAAMHYIIGRFVEEKKNQRLKNH